MRKTGVLVSKDLVLVFALAKAGLGHLRVADALYDGLPPQASGLFLGAQDDMLTWVHRLSSVSPLGRAVQEWMQRGFREDIFTLLFRDALIRHTEILYKQLVTILDQRVEQPKTMLMVATHFALAHQMAAIKKKLAEERKIRVILVVVVTDDSPQHIWAVGGADLIFVPSLRTKNALEAYHATQRMEETKYIVNPYPISPHLGKELTVEQFNQRRVQADPGTQEKIQVAMPISGAAVQLTYLEKLVEGISNKSDRVVWHIVSKQARYTYKFLERMMARKDTKLLISDKDREVVNLYERLYEKERILLQVTKPSEQAFKALVPPKCVGGSILLFSNPVGRQEHDNVNFLRRHNLMPDKELQISLWRVAWRGGSFDEVPEEARRELRSWRGLRLPEGARESVTFMEWCLKEGVFEKMLDFSGYQDHPELSPDGVEMFWEKVSEHLSARSG